MPAFNTNAIAERAGVSIGSLYQYFSNKDAILVALIERRALTFAEHLETVAAGLEGADFAEDLRQVLVQAVVWRETDGRLSRALDAEEERLRPYLDLHSAMGRMDATLHQLIERHGEALGVTDPARAAQRVTVIAKAMMGTAWGCEAPDWFQTASETVGAVMGYLRVAGRSDGGRLTQAAAAP